MLQFIGEQANGSVIEMESRDVTFLENDFPSRCEINKDFQLHEMEDPDNTPTNIIEGNTYLPQYTRPSGSVALHGELNSQEV